MKNNFDNSLRDSASNEEKEIVLKHARFGKHVTITFLFSIYYFEIFMFSAPIIIGRDNDPVRVKQYPLCASYYWDQNSDIMYAIAYTVQVCKTKVCFQFV